MDERAPAFIRSRPGRKVLFVPLECGDLRSKMGFPCLKGLPKAENKKKKVNKKIGKKAAACNEGRPAASAPEARAPWAKLKVTKAKKPERAYITGTLTKGADCGDHKKNFRELLSSHWSHLQQAGGRKLDKSRGPGRKEEAVQPGLKIFVLATLAGLAKALQPQVLQPCQKVCQGRLRCSPVKRPCRPSQCH